MFAIPLNNKHFETNKKSYKLLSYMLIFKTKKKVVIFLDQIEKNISPLIFNNELFFLFWLNPTIIFKAIRFDNKKMIIKCEEYSIINSSPLNKMSKKNLFSISGGSPFVKYKNNEMLSIGHIRLSLLNNNFSWNKLYNEIKNYSKYSLDEIKYFFDEKYEWYYKKMYFMFFFTISYNESNSTFQLKKISDFFHPIGMNREKEKIVFPMSIAYVLKNKNSNNNHYLISYGESDRFCKLWFIDSILIDKILKNINLYSNKSYLLNIDPFLLHKI